MDINFQGHGVHVHEHLLELVQMLQVYYKSEQMIKKRKSPIKKCIALKKFILTITYFFRTKMNNINIINPGLKRRKFKGNFSIISFRQQTGRSLLKLSKSRKKLSIAVVTACQQSTLTQVETKNYESLQQPAS